MGYTDDDLEGMKTWAGKQPPVFKGTWRSINAAAASLGAVLHLVPHLFPFLAPGKRQTAANA